MIRLMALRNVGVDCLYIAIVLLFLPRSLNVLFQKPVLYKPYFNDYYKYTLSLRTKFVLAQVRGNNRWRTSQVGLRLKILNYSKTPRIRT